MIIFRRKLREGDFSTVCKVKLLIEIEGQEENQERDIVVKLSNSDESIIDKEEAIIRDTLCREYTVELKSDFLSSDRYGFSASAVPLDAEVKITG